MKIAKKLLLIIVIISVIFTGVYLYYDQVYLERTSSPRISLIGKNELILKVNSKYIEQGAKASFRKNDISKNIIIDNNIDNNKIGSYEIIYTIKANDVTKSVRRVVKVIDDEKPIITLEGAKEITYLINRKYQEKGYSATDNYDGDLTDKVNVTNNINFLKEGTYEVKYEVTDSSNNVSTEVRKVIYVKPKLKELPSEDALATSIAVLNYHFFYDPNNNEYCGGSNCMTVATFEEELKYLKDKNYKTLTIDEFKQWMYGEIELPARSVLLTIDDGAMGTGKHNGNKLIPLLEKYEMHATLFLVSSWWGVQNYESSFLDIQSHSNNMHDEAYCNGVARGAKMLCLEKEDVLNDLKESISILNSDMAFCHPFYVFTEESIEIIKEAGFKLAFGGGGYKATKLSNKYNIPRYHMYSYTTIEEFNNMIA